MSKIVNKPWGYEEIWAEAEHYVGKILHIDKGHKLSLQYHQYKEETIKVLEGKLELVYSCCGGQMRTITLEEGQTFHVEPMTIHRFCATQGTDVKLVEVSTNYLEDVVRIEDDYER